MNDHGGIREGLNIFNRVYGEVSEKDFINKHYRNPNRLASPIEFFYDAHKPVGMNAFLGIQFKYLDETMLISHSNDTAVLPQYRGRGIFTSIVSEHINRDTDDAFVIGMPNDNSLHGFYKMGFRKIADLTTFVRLNSLAGIVLGHRDLHDEKNKDEEQFAHFDLGDDEEINVSDEVLFSAKEIKRINDWIEIGYLRSNEYFLWRIKGSSHTIKIASLRKKGRLRGYIIYRLIITRRNNRKLVIDDWYVDEIEKKKVFNRILRQVGRDCDIIEVPYVNVESKDMEVIGNNHFIDISKIRRKYRKQPVLVSPQCKLGGLERIQMRYIDSDLILNGVRQKQVRSMMVGR